MRRSRLFVLGGTLVLFALGCVATRQNPNFTYDCGAMVRGDTSRREIALLFTGGDHGQATGVILDTLASRNIPASFFLTGGYLEVEAQRKHVARMLAEGHYVGPHSHAHPLYCAWDDRSRTLVSRCFFTNDLKQNIAALRALHCFDNDRPIYFVPPFEWFNREQVVWAQALGVRLVNLTSGSGSNRDWIPEGEPGFLSSRQIVADVLSYEQREPDGLSGFLLLLHLGSTRDDLMDTELATLVDVLQRRSYQFVRIDALHESTMNGD